MNYSETKTEISEINLKNILYGELIDLDQEIKHLTSKRSSIQTIKYHSRMSAQFFQGHSIEQQLLSPNSPTMKAQIRELSPMVSDYRLQRLKTLHMQTSYVNQKKFQKYLTIQSSSGLAAVWTMLYQPFLFYNLVTTLFFIGFQQPTSWILLIDHLTRLVFVVEIIVRCCLEQENELENQKQPQIALAYIKTWFFFDLVSILPLRQFGRPHIEYFLRLLRLIKGFIILTSKKSLIFTKIAGFLSMGSSSTFGLIIHIKKIQIMFRLLIIMIFTIYSLSCIWYWFQARVPSDNNFQQQFDLDKQSNFRKLIVSCYFITSTMTTVGYGDYWPTNFSQQLFFIIVLLIGVSFFASVMGLFNSVIEQTRQFFEEDNRMVHMGIWLKSLQKSHGPLPQKLKKEILKHLGYYFAHDRNYQMAIPHWRSQKSLMSVHAGYLKEVPLKMKWKILDYVFIDIFYKFQYFLGDSMFKYYLSLLLQPRHFVEKDLISKEGEKIHEILFVTSGEILCGPMIFGKQHPVLIFKEGRTIIGDYSVLTETLQISTYQANSFIDAYCISKQPFIEILVQEFPFERERIMKLAKNRHNHIRFMCRQIKQKLGVHPDYIDNDKLYEKIKQERQRRNKINKQKFKQQYSINSSGSFGMQARRVRTQFGECEDLIDRTHQYREIVHESLKQ